MPRKRTIVDADAASDARANAHEHTDPPIREWSTSTPTLKIAADGIDFVLTMRDGEGGANLSCDADDIDGEGVEMSRTTCMIIGSWLVAVAAGEWEE
jgi:hypothetical protein